MSCGRGIQRGMLSKEYYFLDSVPYHAPQAVSNPDTFDFEGREFTVSIERNRGQGSTRCWGVKSRYNQHPTRTLVAQPPRRAEMQIRGPQDLG